jgi:DNA-binding NarL/FixJ family response regulator
LAHRQPSKPGVRPPFDHGMPGPSNPENLEVHSFHIGTDEYVLLSFSVAPEGSRLDGVDGLSPSERDIVSRVFRGQSNGAIASARGTSPRTVANQLAAIYSKLGVRSRRELVARPERAETAT